MLITVLGYHVSIVFNWLLDHEKRVFKVLSVAGGRQIMLGRTCVFVTKVKSYETG